MVTWVLIGRSFPGLEGEIVDVESLSHGEWGEQWGDEILDPDDPRVPGNWFYKQDRI